MGQDKFDSAVSAWELSNSLTSKSFPLDSLHVGISTQNNGIAFNGINDKASWETLRKNISNGENAQRIMVSFTPGFPLGNASFIDFSSANCLVNRIFDES